VKWKDNNRFFEKPLIVQKLLASPFQKVILIDMGIEELVHYVKVRRKVDHQRKSSKILKVKFINFKKLKKVIKDLKTIFFNGVIGIIIIVYYVMILSNN